MTRYILYRVLWMIPFMLVLLGVIFGLSKMVVTDAVDAHLAVEGVQQQSHPKYLQLYEEKYKALALDKPIFYFSIIPHYYPDNIRSIQPSVVRDNVQSLLHKGYGTDQIDHQSGRLKSDKSLPMYTKVHVPSFRWYGMDNQFHLFVMSVWKGDWGISFLDGLPTVDKVGAAMRWTLTMVILNFILLLLIGLPIVYYAMRGGRIQEVIASAFYVIPLFWLGTLVLVFLSGSAFGIFEPSREEYLTDTTIGTTISRYLSTYLPALLCLLLTDIVVLMRVLKGNILRESDKQYLMTATAKGLQAKDVFQYHLLRNAALPLFTLLISSIPASLSGSIILEIIFNIPGMGRLLYYAIGKADWNVVYLVVFIMGILTTIAYLLGDIMYRLIDPRVKIEAT